ncbi:MAG: crossover junction endodeoxyribonuclease RuvC [Patescibacteria group bacterium]
MKRILGIDPGIERMGWGYIEAEGSRVEYRDCGCIVTPRTLVDRERLVLIRTELQSILARIEPDVVHIERLFFSKNKKTALRVAEARGVIMATLAESGMPIFEFTPNEVKLGVTGVGNAEKRQVAWMVRNILHIKDTISSDDALDALALCLIHPR